MANKDELEITIDKEGNVQIKVIGGDGTSCVDLTKDLEEALGLVVDRRLTEEYYAQPVEDEARIERNE